MLMLYFLKKCYIFLQGNKIYKMKIKTKVILLLVIISGILLLISQVINAFNIYNQNKESTLKDINTTLDNAVEYYYNETAKHNFVAVVGKDSSSFTKFVTGKKFDEIMNVKANTIKKIKIDTIGNSTNNLDFKIVNGKKRIDSISKLKIFTHKIFLSFHEDTLDFKAFEKYFNKELKRKNIILSYQLLLIKEGKIQQKTKNLYQKELIEMTNKSSFLPNETTLILKFDNPTQIILKKGILNLLLSSFLVIFIFLLLIYMLKIIQKQKKIDEIKNDFISNITHELKTPITTIQAAIEGIKHFNEEKNEEKTNKYLDIAQVQNQKLNTIVEKILETATIDVNHLKLNFESTNISYLIENIIIDFKQNNTFKTFNYTIKPNILATVDVFHFQNVINNILDNALKYGGNEIEILIENNLKEISISIEDNGTIDAKERTLIFDKFYRINNGNIHNNKGFGIGLYYAKKIIELHNGTLELKPTKNTNFEIKVPNEEN
jgi:signal transduction histidine kinase